MEKKIGHRYVRQCFHSKNFNLTNIKAELDYPLRESAPLFKTITYWVENVNEANDEIKKKLLHLVKEMFHQDNAPIYTSTIVMTIIELKFELFPRSPYSLDLSPLDCPLSPNWKKCLGGKRFADNEEVDPTIDDCFEELHGSYSKQSIEAIQHRWENFFQIFCVLIVSSGNF